MTCVLAPSQRLRDNVGMLGLLAALSLGRPSVDALLAEWHDVGEVREHHRVLGPEASREVETGQRLSAAELENTVWSRCSEQRTGRITSTAGSEILEQGTRRFPYASGDAVPPNSLSLVVCVGAVGRRRAEEVEGVDVEVGGEVGVCRRRDHGGRRHDVCCGRGTRGGGELAGGGDGGGDVV